MTAECRCRYGMPGRCAHCDSRLRTKDAVEYEWHSTPALWSAVRPGYDGAPDAHCPIGYGKTQEEAVADLLDREAERE